MKVAWFIICSHIDVTYTQLLVHVHAMPSFGVILSLMLCLSCTEFHSDMSDEAVHSDASETSDMSEVSKISTISVRSTQSEKPRRKLRYDYYG